MNTILVAIDFSPVTHNTIAAATRLARGLHAHVCLVHVAPPNPDFIGLEVGPQHVRDQLAHQFQKEHQKLQALESQLKEQGITTSALLIQGPTVEKIISEANRLQADLVVVGSHGHGLLHSALLGSVSDGVVRHSSCPVLIVPSKAK